MGKNIPSPSKFSNVTPNTLAHRRSSAHRRPADVPLDFRMKPSAGLHLRTRVRAHDAIAPRRPKELVTPVGFEPTQLALVELESTPLDHSGKVSCWMSGAPRTGGAAWRRMANERRKQPAPRTRKATRSLSPIARNLHCDPRPGAPHYARTDQHASAPQHHPAETTRT